jgi:hypothetical protein
MKIKNNLLKNIINTFISQIEIYDESNFSKQKWHFLNVEHLEVKDKSVTMKKAICKHSFFNVMGFLLSMYEYDMFSKTLVVDNINPGSKQAISYYHGWSTVTKRYNLFNWLPGLLTNGFVLSRNFITLKQISKNRFAKLNIKYNKQSIYTLGDTPDLVILNSNIFFDHIAAKESTKMHIPCINFLSVGNYPGNSIFRIFDNNLITKNYTKYVWLLKRIMFFGKMIGLSFLEEKHIKINNNIYKEGTEMKEEEPIGKLNLFKIAVLKNILRELDRTKPKKINRKEGFEFYFKFLNWRQGSISKRKNENFIAGMKYRKFFFKSSGRSPSLTRPRKKLRPGSKTRIANSALVENYSRKNFMVRRKTKEKREEKIQIGREFFDLEAAIGLKANLVFFRNMFCFF